MAKQRLPNTSYLNLVTLLATLTEIILCTIFGIYTFYFNVPFGPAIEVCFKNSNASTMTSIGPVIVNSIGVTGLVIGVVYDIKMYRFLKQRKKQVQPGIAMVAWKQEVPAVSYGSNSSLRATVPIQATCLGAVNLVVWMPITFILIKGFNMKSILPYIVKILVFVIVAFHMPMILLLTVKSNSKKPQSVQPPAELQFHEEQE